MNPQKPPPKVAQTKMGLLRDLYAFFSTVTESFEQADHIGSDLVYLFGAILNDSHCAWPTDRPLLRLLHDRYPPHSLVWKFIVEEPTVKPV